MIFVDTNKEFKLEGDLLKLITNKNYKIDLASLSDKKLKYDFAREMHFGGKASSKKSKINRTVIRLPKSPGLMISASGVSNSIFF